MNGSVFHSFHAIKLYNMPLFDDSQCQVVQIKVEYGLWKGINIVSILIGTWLQHFFCEKTYFPYLCTYWAFVSLFYQWIHNPGPESDTKDYKTQIGATHIVEQYNNKRLTHVLDKEVKGVQRTFTVTKLNHEQIDYIKAL